MMSPGKISRDWRLWFLCWNTKGAVGLLALRCYSFYEVLNAFGWCFQPDGKAAAQRDRLPVLQRASKLQIALQRASKNVVSTF